MYPWSSVSKINVLCESFIITDLNKLHVLKVGSNHNVAVVNKYILSPKSVFKPIDDDYPHLRFPI